MHWMHKVFSGKNPWSYNFRLYSPWYFRGKNPGRSFILLIVIPLLDPRSFWGGKNPGSSILLIFIPPPWSSLHCEYNPELGFVVSEAETSRAELRRPLAIVHIVHPLHNIKLCCTKFNWNKFYCTELNCDSTNWIVLHRIKLNGIDFLAFFPLNVKYSVDLTC